jgi:hypothetical protein
MSNRCFVAADFSNMEGRLTAFYSKDPVLQQELDDELKGGFKVHAKTAALLYGIDPAEAKTHMVNLQGNFVPAYDAGKRLSHAFNYGMGYRQMNKQFWCGEEFAKEAIGKLSAKYEKVVAWRKELADDVFGVLLYGCPRCGYQQEHDNTDCPQCALEPLNYPIPMRYVGLARPAKRGHHTAFGRRRFYLGRRKEGMNALAAQDPQSSGASIWNITFARLHGHDSITNTPWPHPQGILVYDPRLPVSHLFKPSEIFVASGHYDSFYLESQLGRRDEVLSWLIWTMEQPWNELGGLRLPAEGSWGFNMGKHSSTNPNGLQEVKSVPFTRLG